MLLHLILSEKVLAQGLIVALKYPVLLFKALPCQLNRLFVTLDLNAILKFKLLDHLGGLAGVHGVHCCVATIRLCAPVNRCYTPIFLLEPRLLRGQVTCVRLFLQLEDQVLSTLDASKFVGLDRRLEAVRLQAIERHHLTFIFFLAFV